mmetsp:Transcript_10351/g.20739  ORF Transcript_10351/g.20739 Transcript_10351/m.20739 type:complete len:573 (+) Transcript_10351:1404-3122(+)
MMQWLTFSRALFFAEADENACEADSSAHEIDAAKVAKDIVLYLVRRRCFAHVLRMPGRGGGYRGGKGSIPRALLKFMSHREMGKVVHKLITMNYADCADTVRYALELLKKEHNFTDRIIKDYLNGDLMDLGGRAAGRAGEVGSTQGLERKGGNVKDRHRELIASSCGKNKAAEKGNFLNILLACAMEKSFDTAKDGVATKPDRSALEGAYDVIRTIANLKSKPGSPPADFVFSFCQVDDGEDTKESTPCNLQPLHDVVGKVGAEEQDQRSITIFWPSLSRVYTSMKIMLEENKTCELNVGMLDYQNIRQITDPFDLSDQDECNKMLKTLTMADITQLKKELEKTLLRDSTMPFAWENSLMYLYRRCQRYSIQTIKNNKDKKMKGLVRKPIQRKRRRNQRKSGGKSADTDDVQTALELDKWGPSEDVDDETSADASKNALNEVKEGDESDVVFPEDCEDVDEILMCLENEGGITLDDNAYIELDQMRDRSNRVKVRRELGDWIRTKITTDENGHVKIRCNCERYNFWRDCRHVVWAEVLHLRKFPPNNMKKASDNWDKIASDAMDIICKTCNC